MKIMNDFPKNLILFRVSKYEWDTKEGTGKLMKMHCVYNSMVNGTSWTRATSSSEKIKLVITWV